jgi:hypothetical protein
VTAAVFDANVLSFGFVRSHAPPGELLRLWRQGVYTRIVSKLLNRQHNVSESSIRAPDGA